MAIIMFNSILVVCTGNICRSPIGERILKQLLPTMQVDSAGTAALIDHNADNSAIKIAKKHGISLEGHKGKQFTAKLARNYDLILAMEKIHINQIEKIAPEARGKTMLFGHWLENRDIPDPYRKSDEAFASVFVLIQRSSQLWVEKLIKA
ncbi:TPA: protein tyrosine phosphatase [Escherichia coli]|uniref:protein-tyrosine-phosphatase n=4 Tax=Enterobacterales TaxID=91347 RepID=A0A0P0YSL0_9ENTR|nr:protein tyrosine phosphatase [Escherichia coli]EIY5385692.1 protein tyrosine phosphatase [Klebsiella variicola]EKV8918912.1 protein tyrosine phosphatase [Klebsiella pneumoniae]KAE9753639.1 protein tyrosine phosphatase [Enterobacteriaceae bacterium TzEc084]MBC4314026.1 protein tyrosine phosphatase [Klebsiella quasipneumoniae]MCD9684940.1 protein tyrosine phosphatase [Klebsiella variicola subsp. variicola]MDK1921705.1 protein tyrosine phosphatase [Klebsiella sp. K4-41]MVX93891.1 protein tyr